ncbi:hypothetical protein [Streptomyces sp. NRRL F-5650]|nr:hypothetical protein [Streptomyces sp. NRRL F-5650]
MDCTRRECSTRTAADQRGSHEGTVFPARRPATGLLLLAPG